MIDDGRAVSLGHERPPVVAGPRGACCIGGNAAGRIRRKRPATTADCTADDPAGTGAFRIGRATPEPVPRDTRRPRSIVAVSSRAGNDAGRNSGAVCECHRNETAATSRSDRAGSRLIVEAIDKLGIFKFEIVDAAGPDTAIGAGRSAVGSAATGTP